MKMRIVALAQILVLALFLYGCVRSPQDGQIIGRAIDFNGYGIAEGDGIAVSAYNKSTHRWDVLGNTTTRNSAININGTDLYPFEATVDMTGKRNWPCYFHASCRFPEEGLYSGRFRLTERGNDLITFDSKSDPCISDGLSAGDDPVTIGFDCAAEETYILTLKTAVFWPEP